MVIYSNKRGKMVLRNKKQKLSMKEPISMVYNLNMYGLSLIQIDLSEN